VKVLVVDDDAAFCRMLEPLLASWGHQAVMARDGHMALEAFSGDAPPRLVLLDWMLPRVDGLEILRQIRRRGPEGYIYTIVLTARHEHADVIAALGAEADDFVAKPFRAEELRLRLRTGQRIVELHAALVAARAEARLQAAHDGMTGLWNRVAILDALQRELARGQRERHSVAVAMIDDAHFKAVNDRVGHLGGDGVLCHVAGRLAAALRAYDPIGRYGGEEFLVVLPTCDRKMATTVAERLRRMVADSPISDPAALSVTVSIGVAVSDPDSPATALALVGRADGALYRAKAAGRNRVVVAAAPVPTAGRPSAPRVTIDPAADVTELEPVVRIRAA
jgi:diguanylate cyclase (GGDEF)-like protein